MLLQYMSGTHVLCVRERERGVSKIPDLFIILGCEHQQQEEAVRSVRTQDGQENTIYMHQVQKVYLQHTHSKALPLMCCIG